MTSTTTTSSTRTGKRSTSHITSLTAVPASAEELTTSRGVEHLDPAGLLVDVNVRHDARVDKDFIASIRDHGVLVPVIAVRTSENQIRVRFGHRRALAAIEAGLPSVPVLVVADEGCDDAAQVERLVTQYAENQHRTGLTTAEQVGVAAQLAAFGVTPTQIARKTRMPRTRVDAALAIAGSDLAKAATMRYELTLEQAAVIAEFDDDTETVKGLVAAAKTGQFAHAAQRARDQRAEQQSFAEAAQALTDTGVRVITRQGAHDGRTQALRTLSADPDTRKPITRRQHADCPGHAAYLDHWWTWIRDDELEDDNELEDQTQADHGDKEDDGHSYGEEEEDRWRWTPVYVCTDPTGHGHHPRWPSTSRPARKPVAEMSDDEREIARAERRDVIESNKAWDSATTVRRTWLRGYLTRKSAPKGTPTFLAGSLAADADTLASIQGNHLAASLLSADDAAQFGRSHALTRMIETAGDARAQVIHLALVLAAYEAATSRDDWRTPNPRTSRYLTRLATLGYTLAPVEHRAAGKSDPDSDQE